MATEKILNTRIQLKYDTLDKWKALPADKILKAGEVAVVEIPGNTQTVTGKDGLPKVITTDSTLLFKVGNGSEPFNSLPWLSALAADVYDWAKLPWSSADTSVDTFVKKVQNEAGLVTSAEFDEWVTTTIGATTDDKTKTTIYGKIAAAQDKANSAYNGLANKADAGTTYNKTEVNTLVGNVDKKITGDASSADDKLKKGIYGRLDALEVFTGTTAGSIYATKDELNALKEGTNDTAASATIKGAKLYADKKIADLTKAYLEVDPENPDENKAIDKLIEVADWIKDDETGAAKLAATVDQLKTAIDNGKLTDENTTYSFANGTNGNFTVTPSGGTAKTIDTGAKTYTDTVIGSASKGNTAATGLHAVIEAGDTAVRDALNSRIANVENNYVHVNESNQLCINSVNGDTVTELVLVISGGTSENVW